MLEELVYVFQEWGSRDLGFVVWLEKRITLVVIAFRKIPLLPTQIR